MKIEDGIHSLNSLGLNIFLSAKVSDFPDDIYPFSDEQKKKHLVLIGHGGPALWDNIPDLTVKNPIDSFSIDQMNWFALNCLENDIEILFPDDETLLPLQKLGRFFNLSHQSPLGFDISSEYGLWFAFRGVFLTNNKIPPLTLSPRSSPCDECSLRPCMTASDIFDARMKCPTKTEHQYSLEQRTYHQSIVLNIKNRD